MRVMLWPDPVEEHRREVRRYFDRDSNDAVVFLATPANVCVGFVEASIRHEQVNGSETCPVAFLEGLFVEQQHRRMGVAAALREQVESWARAKGQTELVSDTDLDNAASAAWHLGQGFEETERVIFYRKLPT